MFKPLFNKIKNLLEELEYEWWTYTHLRKFAQLNSRRINKHNHGREVLITGLVLFLFFIFLKTVSADVAGDISPTTPEPASIALVGGGMLGMIIRFARKRFQEFKRVMDILFSLIGLALTAPILAVAIALIKMTSKGPVFFNQERVGKEGEIFNIYKLRTMRMDAEKYTGPVWAKENDPRITLVGRFLRKAHIDEIPQLVNVLRGEMAIVGPRPERPVFVRDLSRKVPEYEKRLRVKPGITGLAQVRHKYDETIEDVKKKIKLDLLYIKEMCVMTDLRIMAMTILVVLTGKGAR